MGESSREGAAEAGASPAGASPVGASPAAESTAGLRQAARGGAGAALTRRAALRLLGAAVFGQAAWLSIPRMVRALAEAPRIPRVVWWREGGAELSLLTLFSQAAPDFLSLLHLEWDGEELELLQPAGVSRQPLPAAQPPIVLVEQLPGAEAWAGPTGERLEGLLEQAQAVILLGSGASYGVLGNTEADLQGFMERCRLANTPLLKLPGAPPPPQHLVGMVAHLALLGFPRLDAQLRPLLYYGRTVCADCERQGDLQLGRFAGALGEAGCLLELGCKGPLTHNSCAVLRWNEGSNWCVGAGGPCTGCAAPGWPQHAGLGLYGSTADPGRGAAAWSWRQLRLLGGGAVALGAAGALLQLVRGYFLPRRSTSAPPPKGGAAHLGEAVSRPLGRQPPIRPPQNPL